ncbi:uncharacterized protein LOC129761726 [Toxorhynchites rutilus septentrionalis]|uniref:uncharacterized protein LOC129761726 n=1 Tax=Toxorhynchites rutilus septentrionalis TaxID=329112 RepID=UPI0024798B4D|nr:uncharacterized protein LOC129761726 [Toxorhynchites rutilus septentrionalis]
MERERGRVLWTCCVILLSGFTCVHSEMKKSWKMKSNSVNTLSGALDFTPDDTTVVTEPAGIGSVQSDLKLFGLDAVKQNDSLQQDVTQKAPTTATSQPKSRLRSTYVVKGAVSLFNAIRESAKTAPFVEDHEPEIQIDDFSANETEEELYDDNQIAHEEFSANGSKYSDDYKLIESILEEVKDAAERDEAAKGQEEEQVKPSVSNDSKQYDFGPLLNMTIDEPNNIVKVKINERVLREIFTGRSRGGGGGGGSKKMWKYALPLFILPFLIQSAIIPFLLTTVKLFLVKSLLAGKLAIFLLLLGAFKNFTQKKEREVYVKDIPERRYEPYNELPYPYHSSSESRPSWAN